MNYTSSFFLPLSANDIQGIWLKESHFIPLLKNLIRGCSFLHLFLFAFSISLLGEWAQATFSIYFSDVRDSQYSKNFQAYLQNDKKKMKKHTFLISTLLMRIFFGLGISELRTNCSTSFHRNEADFRIKCVTYPSTRWCLKIIYVVKLVPDFADGEMCIDLRLIPMCQSV